MKKLRFMCSILGCLDSFIPHQTQQSSFFSSPAKLTAVTAYRTMRKVIAVADVLTAGAAIRQEQAAEEQLASVMRIEDEFAVSCLYEAFGGRLDIQGDGKPLHEVSASYFSLGSLRVFHAVANGPAYIFERISFERTLL